MSKYSPEIWGPQFWFTLHNGASQYPERASPSWQGRMKNFILGIPVMVPCEKCSMHACAYIESQWEKLDRIVEGRESLFQFFVDFHNFVNLKLNKPTMDLDLVREKY